MITIKRLYLHSPEGETVCIGSVVGVKLFNAVRSMWIEGHVVLCVFPDC